jgi:hypothetical protein
VPTWSEIPLNTACDPTTSLGVVKLPKATPDLSKARVLIKAGDKQRLLKVDYRSDGGEGACLSERDHRALGRSAAGKYREVTKLEALRLDPSLRLALFTAIVTFASAVLGLILAYDKATASDPDTGTGPDTAALVAAAVVALLAFIIAVLKLNKDLNEI